MVLHSGPLEEVGAASTAEAYRWGWGASEGLPCSASEEGSCEVLRDRRACCGSSCSRRGPNSSKEAGYAAHNKCSQTLVKTLPGGRGGRSFCQLTIGGWLLLAPDARGAPPWAMEWPPEVGSGASPSSAIRDRYSLSIRALSCADCGGSLPGARCAVNELQTHTHTCTGDINKGCNIVNCGEKTSVQKRPHLVYLQSDEMWPAPPHFVQRVVLVMLRGSVFCHGRRILQTQERQRCSELRDKPGAAGAAGAPTCCRPP